jgi:cell division protein FtsQ
MVARKGKGVGAGRPNKRKTKARRRFDVELGVTGAEVRLPALPALQPGWRLLSGLLVVALLGLLYTVWNSPVYTVEIAEVDGVQRLTPIEINTVMKVAGKSIFEIDPAQLQRDLQEAFPELYDIRVQVGFPSQVRAAVVERQPVLEWRQEGSSIWVDENGVAFPPRGQVDVQAVVEAKTSVNRLSKEFESDEVFLEAELIDAVLMISKDAPGGIPLVYDQEHGLGWKDPKGWQVYFGQSGQDMETKMKVYQALVERLDEKDIIPALISVEYVHAPYYRMDR